jgi:hypothetical protein
MGFVADKVALGQAFLEVYQFTHQYHFTHSWEMKNRPVGGRSSQT